MFTCQDIGCRCTTTALLLELSLPMILPALTKVWAAYMYLLPSTVLACFLFVAILPYTSYRHMQDWCQAVPEVAGNKLHEKWAPLVFWLSVLMLCIRFGGSPPIKQLQQCQICMVRTVSAVFNFICVQSLCCSKNLVHIALYITQLYNELYNESMEK